MTFGFYRCQHSPQACFGVEKMLGANDGAPSISSDGRWLFVHSERPGGQGDLDLWQASIEPLVDFDGDGIVDCVDICMLVDYWETDEPLYDIGPKTAC